MRDIMSQDPAGDGSSTSKIGDTFQKIQFGLKMVPSMDNHNYILQRMSMVGNKETEYDGLESDVEYDENAIGDYSDYPPFFEWNGAQHMTFPNFNFDADHVPLGDSVKMCLGLSWTTLKKRNQYDKYLDVRGFDMCSEA